MKKNQKLKSKDKNQNILNILDNKPIYVYALIIGIIAFLLYVRTVGFNLVYCDDDLFILKFEEFNKDLANILRSFISTLASGTNYYRPMLSVTFIIENNIAGTAPWIYHLTNVLLHTIGSVVVFYTLIKLKFPKLLSFFFGLIFAVHPILTPSAVWISGRNDSLVTIFLLISFINLINYLDNKRKIKYLLLHILLLLLGLFTKEMAIILPVAGFFYLILYRDEQFKLKENYILFSGWVICSLVWFLLRMVATQGIDSPDKIGFASLLVNYPTIFAMLGKVFLPIKLAPVSYFTTLSVVSGIIVIVLITFFTLYLKSVDKKKVLFGGLWYLMFLFPTLSILLYDHFFDFAEHRTYILLIGIFIILAEFIIALKIDIQRSIPKIVFLLIFLIFSSSAFAYSNKIDDKFSFWSHIRKSFPNKPKSYIILGEVYQEKGQYVTADKLFRRAIALKGETLNLYINLSSVSINLKNYDDAIRFGKMAIEKDPTSGFGWYNHGRALIRVGKFEEGEKSINEALRIDPKNVDWKIEFGNTYFEVAQYQKAIEIYQQVLPLLKDNDRLSSVYSNMGSCYGQLGRMKDAEQMFLKSIAHNPKSDITYLNLIVYYCKEEKNLEKANFYAEKYKSLGLVLPPDVVAIMNLVRKELNRY